MESPEIEELTLCGYCKKKFNDSDQSPKLLSCKHYFCLQCMRTSLTKGPELYCAYCWKKTELGDLGPESLPTHTPVLCLTKKFSQLKLFSTASGQTASSNKGPAAAPSPGEGGKTKVISENCHTHAMPLALWCTTCLAPVCRACASTSDHATHQVKSQNEAKDQLITDLQIDLSSMTKLLCEIQRLAGQQREFLLKILEACVTLKTHVEADLTNNTSQCEVTETRENLAKLRLNLSMVDTLTDVHQLCASVAIEKQRLQLRYQDMYLQCQLDDLIKNSTVVLDFQTLKQALGNLHNGEISIPGSRQVPMQQNPILFLANYCMSQLYSRHVMAKQQPLNNGLDYHNHNSIPQPALLPNMNYLNHQPNSHQSNMQQSHPQLVPIGGPPKNIYQDNSLIMQNLVHSPQLRNPANMCPLYFFNVDVNGSPIGRIVIEVRADVAPKMAKNFGVLATGEMGMCYKGCQIFQCWEGESVITGDFELNNGRGGRSIFEDLYFLPDDTKLLAVRGTVGMRRTQKRHDNLGMVGSQFRIILQEMRGFTGIFGHVVEGLELVEKISTYGDTAGKPTKNIVITKCGKL